MEWTSLGDINICDLTGNQEGLFLSFDDEPRGTFPFFSTGSPSSPFVSLKYPNKTRKTTMPAISGDQLHWYSAVFLMLLDTCIAYDNRSICFSHLATVHFCYTRSRLSVVHQHFDDKESLLIYHLQGQRQGLLLCSS